MALCINKNSVQYQSLKNRAGIPEFILEAVSRDFMEKYGRLPHLDELPNSNSEPYLRDQLGVTKHNSAKVESILEMTGKETIEEAVIDINNQFRDLETTIIPINKEALVDIVHRPTDNNFDNWTEEDQILAEAPRDNNGNLLAPNGKVSNLTEKQYIQVRTKAFKDWFGDWEEVAPKATFKKGDIISIGDSNFTVSRVEKDSNYNVLIVYVKESLQIRRGGYIPSLNAVIVSEINTDEETIKHELIHSKEYNVDTSSLNNLYEKIKQTITDDSFIDGVISNNFRKNIHEFIADALTKSVFRNALKKEGILDEVETAINNVIEKTPKGDVSKVVDENGEPLVVYHYTDNDNLTEFSIDFDNYFAQHGGTKKAIFFTRDNVIPGSENNFLTSRKHKLSLFLNIRDITEYRGTKEDLHKKGTTYVQVINESAQKNDIDGGLVFKGLDDNRKLDQTIYVVHNPKQIKSAVSNLGAFSRLNRNIYDIEPNGYLVLNNALQKLASLHGITFNETSDAELNSEKWQDIIPDASLVNAFIYNGQIYINLDRANLDAPIHEMFHMFVGSLRFTNPSLYQALVDSTQSFPNYEQLVQEYPGRTRNDVNEEILVTEVSRYLTGQPSSLAKMDSKTRYEISYNIKRMLDTILMGQDSVKTISEDRLFNLSLKEIAQEVNSAVMVNNFTGTMNVEGSELHRRLNNVKSDLYREGTLEEHCD